MPVVSSPGPVQPRAEWLQTSTVEARESPSWRSSLLLCCLPTTGVLGMGVVASTPLRPLRSTSTPVFFTSHHRIRLAGQRRGTRYRTEAPTLNCLATLTLPSAPASCASVSSCAPLRLASFSTASYASMARTKVSTLQSPDYDAFTRILARDLRIPLDSTASMRRWLPALLWHWAHQWISEIECVCLGHPAQVCSSH